jgi:hypothetical protein
MVNLQMCNHNYETPKLKYSIGKESIHPSSNGPL